MDSTHPYFKKGRRGFDEHKEDDGSWVDDVHQSLAPMLQPARCDYASTESPAYKKHKNALRAYKQGRITRETRDRRITEALNDREAEARSAEARALSHKLAPEAAMEALRAAGFVSAQEAP